MFKFWLINVLSVTVTSSRVHIGVVVVVVFLMQKFFSLLCVLRERTTSYVPRVRLVFKNQK